MESFLYKADVDGSSLLHMAVDSGVLKVRWLLSNMSLFLVSNAMQEKLSFDLLE